MSEAETRYSIAFTLEASADVKALDGSIRNKLKKVLLKKIALDPQGYGLPLRSPLQLFWKHEFARHRLIYRIYEEKRRVVICAVGLRKEADAADIYEQFQALAQAGKVAQQIADVLGRFAPSKKKPVRQTVKDGSSRSAILVARTNCAAIHRYPMYLPGTSKRTS